MSPLLQMPSSEDNRLSKSHQLLRDRLQMIEQLWGSVLLSEYGQEMVDLLQKMRQVSSPEGQAEGLLRSSVPEMIEELPIEDAIQAARAFALYFQLINIVEQHYEQKEQKNYRLQDPNPQNGKSNGTSNGVGEAEIIAAAKKAKAWSFIPELVDVHGNKGLDALVGERGVNLSGGQRQRIAIARVILKDAPLLVLDEATSALDSEVEAAIQEQLYELMEGKTVIAIAHRLSTIAKMDRLIVMDEGRVVEDGSHEDLVDAGGRYAQLWSRQSGGFLYGGRSGTQAAE